MNGLALAEVRPAPGSVRRGVMESQLASLRLPRRSAELLGGTAAGLQALGPRRDSTADTATKAAGEGLRRLVAALCGGAGDRDAFRAAVASLVGLGPGLTPTGDDLLVALLATARRLAEADLLPGAAADRLADAVVGIGDGTTTPVARRLLAEAVLRRYPAPLAAVVAALGAPGADFARLTSRLVATGAHSGADWLAGVVALAGACLARRGDE